MANRNFKVYQIMLDGYYLYIGKTSELLDARLRRHYTKPVSKSMRFFLSNMDPKKVVINLVQGNLTENEACDMELVEIGKLYRGKKSILLNDKYIEGRRMWNTLGYQLNRSLEDSVVDKYIRYGNLEAKKPKIELPKNYTIRCPKCREQLHFEKFEQDNSRSTGRRCWCRACTAKRKMEQKKAYEVENRRLYPNGAADWPQLTIVCTRCKQEKKNIEYYFNYRSKKFINTICKTCKHLTNNPRISDDTPVKCSHCKDVKKAKEFFTNTRQAKGIQSCCKKCNAKRRKVWVDKKRAEKADEKS